MGGKKDRQDAAFVTRVKKLIRMVAGAAIIIVVRQSRARRVLLSMEKGRNGRNLLVRVWQKVFEIMVLSRAFGSGIGSRNLCDEASKQSSAHRK
jgi:hypothetical protein